MSGVLKLIDEVLSVLDRGLPGVLCTVAATRGSTPQKPGAMMLVFGDGSQSGTIGGGCVESEVKKRVLALLTSKAEGARVYSFLLDNDYGWGDGLICGGQMTISAEPLTRGHREYFRTLHRLLRDGLGFTEVIAISESFSDEIRGSRAVYGDDGHQYVRLGNHFDFAWSEKHLRPAVLNGIAILPTRSRVTLLIVGGGHVGQAVARLAHDLDFATWIVDDREKFADAERFPFADRRIVGDIGRELQAIQSVVDPTFYCLIVTRGHSHDEEALYHLINTPASYIGMIGSKRKVRLIFDDLLAKGISAESLARVRAPIGLGIGSQTVPEIAISICAELIARRNLGMTATNIHDELVGLKFKDRT